MVFIASESVVAQVSEIDSYDRAVTSETKEAALAFLDEFRSSHLVGDLIESLRPDVARAVCADLPSGVSRARRACEQLRTAPVAEAPTGSEERAGSTAQSTVVAAPTQPNRDATDRRDAVVSGDRCGRSCAAERRTGRWRPRRTQCAQAQLPGCRRIKVEAAWRLHCMGPEDARRNFLRCHALPLPCVLATCSVRAV
jgi:hypothetical protein